MPDSLNRFFVHPVWDARVIHEVVGWRVWDAQLGRYIIGSKNLKDGEFYCNLVVGWLNTGRMTVEEVE